MFSFNFIFVLTFLETRLQFNPEAHSEWSRFISNAHDAARSFSQVRYLTFGDLYSDSVKR